MNVFLQGTVLTPTMDHAMSIQPTSMMGPLTQQLSHLTLGSTGTVSPAHTHTYKHTTAVTRCISQKMALKLSGSWTFSSLPSLQYIPANTTMQGTYIPQYTPVPPSSVPVEV